MGRYCGLLNISGVVVASGRETAAAPGRYNVRVHFGRPVYSYCQNTLCSAQTFKLIHHLFSCSAIRCYESRLLHSLLRTLSKALTELLTSANFIV